MWWGLLDKMQMRFIMILAQQAGCYVHTVHKAYYIEDNQPLVNQLEQLSIIYFYMLHIPVPLLKNHFVYWRCMQKYMYANASKWH